MFLWDESDDKLREECGVFGIAGHEEAAAVTALGLHALQHRGQEAAGIVSYDGKHFHSERRIGLVSDHFTKKTTMERMQGQLAMGHVRYSTTGEPALRNVQPLFADLSVGGFAIAHNGNFTNAFISSLEPTSFISIIKFNLRQNLQLFSFLISFFWSVIFFYFDLLLNYYY